MVGQNKKITYRLDTHGGKKVIFIIFDYDLALNQKIKSLAGAKWSKTQKAWYVSDTPAYRKMFGIESSNKLENNDLFEKNANALKRFIETLQLKGYSSNTIKTYSTEFRQLLTILKNKDIDELNPEKLRDYFLFCRNKLKLSENTIHSRMNAVKFYFEQVLKREKVFIEIYRPKKPILMPNVLAIGQIEKLFSQLENLKHKTMLFLTYSAGLRVSEVVYLRIKDIHSERMVINIKGAKGKKDRVVALSQGVLELLRKYYLAYRPKHWLFEGQYGDQYSTRSLQSIFNRAKRKANIRQDVTFHSLRHSYATHLHEAGTDIKLIQELLGHNDIKTTLRYTHVSNRTLANIQSPFDKLNLKKDD